MDKRAALTHIAIASAVGALIAAALPVSWLAASLWVSAAILLNGVVAIIEDARHGGFDNPDGTNSHPGLVALSLKIAIAALALIGSGLFVQFALFTST